jgi:hypothetical protein
VYLPVGRPVNIVRIEMRAGVRKRRSRHRAADRTAGVESDPELAGENPDVAVAMFKPELDDLFFGRGRARFCVGQHQLLRDGVVDPVGLDVKVMVVTDDKCHFVKSTSNGQRYKIFPQI